MHQGKKQRLSVNLSIEKQASVVLGPLSVGGQEEGLSFGDAGLAICGDRSAFGQNATKYYPAIQTETAQWRQNL
jgi:hypothetical protein